MKNLVVLGGGESGIGSAILAKKHGLNVFLSEQEKIKTQYKNILFNHSIEFEEGAHNEKKIIKSDLIIKSPGISHNSELIKKIKYKKIELISEIEFASRYTKSKIIAITGSNGKTTTTSLTYSILKNAGLHVVSAGNIGKSFAMQVAQTKFDYYVLEISSFQLDDCYKFKPYISTILNLSPDHLDQYNKKKNYYRTKFKITQSIDENDFFILNQEDIIINQFFKEFQIRAKIIPFSSSKKFKNTTYLENNQLIINIEPLFRMNIKHLKIKGIHNITNAAVAGTIAKLLQINNKEIETSLKKFKGVEHRLEQVAKINKITFINDSKSTNINSLYYALITIQSPIILILGGIDKGNNYKKIFDLVIKKVKKIICIGINNKPIKNIFKSKIEIFETYSMKECVQKSFFFAKSGDTILLSPACSSLDLFQNFEDRGNQFKKEIIILKNNIL